MAGSGRTRRTDIQALRAFAVLAVILNHLWPDALPGGYVGVDVFFVISGYLITVHLLDEQRRSGRIALGSFWARRARRLLPAALVVLLVCVALSYTVIPPTTRAEDLSQIGWAALYVLNWALVGQSVDYFAQESGQTLVTHYWSLSVEEQFYLVWPLLLVVVFAVTRSMAPERRRLVVGGAFAGVAIASFAWALFATAQAPDAAYFQTTARAWEFAVGGLLALVPVRSALSRGGVAAVWGAWLVLFLGVFVLGPDAGVPGWAALVPVGATALLIALGDSARRSPAFLTARRPVQWLGDVSYSAYLWHFPLIVAAVALLARDLAWYEGLGVLAATLVLAGLTTRYVEKPFRSGGGSRVRPRAVLAASIAAMIVVGGGVGGAAALDRARSGATSAELLSLAEEGAECFGARAVLSDVDCADSHVLADPEYLDEAPTDTFANDPGGAERITCDEVELDGTTVTRCEGGVPDGEQRLDVVLVGDSHMAMWRSAVRNISDDHDLRITTYLLGSCSMTLDDDVEAVAGQDPKACREWRSAVMDEITGSDADVIITTAYAGGYTYRGGGEDSGAGYREAWRTWLNAGKSVIVLEDVPKLRAPIDECVTEDGVDTVDPCARDAAEARTESVLSRAAAQIEHRDFHFVDYNDVLCDEELCHAIVGGIPAYQDSNHLSLAFTTSFGGVFLQREFEEILG